MTGCDRSGAPSCRVVGLRPQFWDDSHFPLGLHPIWGLLSILVSVEGSPALPRAVETCRELDLVHLCDCPELVLFFEVLGYMTHEGQEAGEGRRKKREWADPVPHLPALFPAGVPELGSCVWVRAGAGVCLDQTGPVSAGLWAELWDPPGMAWGGGGPEAEHICRHTWGRTISFLFVSPSGSAHSIGWVYLYFVFFSGTLGLLYASSPNLQK